MPNFRIEQIALFPPKSHEAIVMLMELGLTEWVMDQVDASGQVFGSPARNTAVLNFNYDAGSGNDSIAGKPLELEVLTYTEGEHWMEGRPHSVSHLGMHVTEAELDAFSDYFRMKGIHIAQTVETRRHTNPVIAGKRTYKYIIFDTRRILGVDLKFIVRRDVV
jgi:hypothetical protein